MRKNQPLHGFTLIELLAIRHGSWRAMSAGKRGAFTLVELLVVITIITVLLAILSPALDKAIYMTELTVCATQARGLGSAAIAYAFDHGRHYPWHADSAKPNGLNGPDPEERRAGYRPYISIGKALNCPLAPRVDYEDTLPDSWVTGSYDMWFGFSHRSPEKGMFRIGDRWTFAGESFNLLLSDHYHVLPGGGPQYYGSHPDSEGVLGVQTHQDGRGEENPRGQLSHHTYGRWYINGMNPGLVDLNFVFDDLSAELQRSVPNMNNWTQETHANLTRVPAQIGQSVASYYTHARTYRRNLQ